jgi:hypothetical protein
MPADDATECSWRVGLESGETMPGGLPEVKCVLCGKPVDPLGPVFRATGDFLPTGDPRDACANVPLHWTCYAEWPQRASFAKHFIDAWVKANRKNPYWWRVHLDERVYISVNPESPVEEASVRLVRVGDDIRVPLGRWRAWLESPAEVTPELQPLELAELDEVLPLLRARYPDDHAVVHAIDPDEKRPRGKK